MPCQHLTQIQQLKLPISDSDVLKVICPVCGSVEVCAYTPLETDEFTDKVSDSSDRTPCQTQTDQTQTSNAHSSRP